MDRIHQLPPVDHKGHPYSRAIKAHIMKSTRGVDRNYLKRVLVAAPLQEFWNPARWMRENPVHGFERSKDQPDKWQGRQDSTSNQRGQYTPRPKRRFNRQNRATARSSAQAAIWRSVR